MIWEKIRVLRNIDEEAERGPGFTTYKYTMTYESAQGDMLDDLVAGWKRTGFVDRQNPLWNAFNHASSQLATLRKTSAYVVGHGVFKYKLVLDGFGIVAGQIDERNVRQVLKQNFKNMTVEGYPIQVYGGWDYVVVAPWGTLEEAKKELVAAWKDVVNNQKKRIQNAVAQCLID